MYHGSIILAIIAAALATLFFSTITFALRDLSRSRLQQWLKRHGREEQYQRIADESEELAFTTAVARSGPWRCATRRNTARRASRSSPWRSASRTPRC